MQVHYVRPLKHSCVVNNCVVVLKGVDAGSDWRVIHHNVYRVIHHNVSRVIHHNVD